MKMNSLLLIACAGLLAGIALSAQEVVEIWPTGKIPFRKSDKPERVLPSKDTIIRITDVNVPTLTVYPAPEAKSPSPAILVCPGGGYGILAINHEGTEIAEWMNAQGITAFVLKYRVPGQADSAFCDAQRAMGWIRQHAEKYRVDPKRVGIIGFSAGANLSVRVSTNYRERFYEPVDEADSFSCRPDFSLIIYPWHLIQGKDSDKDPPAEMLADRYPVDSQTPPAFILQAEDDGCHVENSLAYFLALKQARVPAEMHLYPSGGHGYGMRTHKQPTDAWPPLAAAWLQRILKH
ncbi:MAG: alpha/beta hydrolase [Kiritimatiellae bacterium]|nr:alpha/beta hydrolase [Kiritimatiellia bacterium]